MKQENFYRGPVVEAVRGLFASEDDVLVAARRRAADAGLPLIEVAPEDGALLALLVRLVAPAAVVEIGSLFGYSAIWMGRALPPGGRLYTIESDPRHAEIARRNVAAAGLAEQVRVVAGRAGDVLGDLPTPVDMVFVDADKESYPDYLRWARRALRPGGLLAADNAFMQGHIVAPEPGSGAAAVAEFLAELASDPAWEPAMAPTLEGMALAVRLGG